MKAFAVAVLAFLILGCSRYDEYIAVVQDLAAVDPQKHACVSSVFFSSPDSSLDSRLIRRLEEMGYGILEPGFFGDTASVLIALSPLESASRETSLSASLIETLPSEPMRNHPLVFRMFDYRLNCAGDGCAVRDRWE